jgi:hypothetical protein
MALAGNKNSLVQGLSPFLFSNFPRPEGRGYKDKKLSNSNL